jgi:hypothetical protein
MRKDHAIMATIDDLIAGIEVEREAAQKRRDKCSHEVKAILALAGQEGRSNLTPEEDERVTQLFVARDQAKADLRGIQTKLENADRIKAEEAEAVKQAREVKPTAAAERRPVTRESVARVGVEERTYNPDFDRRGKQFLRDVVRQFLFQDVDASTRLSRHMAEERVERADYLTRAVGTGAFTGLTVPQYLTDMYAPATAALRPFADICNKHDLPAEGMTVNISRITTATGVALQATENAAVQETNADDTLLTENVQTAAGQQTVSRQAIDRGTGIDDVLMDDLFRRYATALDSTLINQATTGLSAVSTAITYDDASATAAELYPKILAAASGAEAALLAQATPTHAVMHSRRWYWLASQMTSTWPFINSTAIPVQAGGTANDVGYNKGIRGRLPIGLQVVVDNNISTALGTATSQDEVYVVPDAECHLWEDPQAPVFIRAEQPAAASLGVLMVLYGYFAYSFRRYTNGMQKVGGTGLTTPSF